MNKVKKTSFEEAQLITGKFPFHAHAVTIAAGQNLERGAVLGKITASGKYKLSAAAAEDGSQTATVILAEDVDATAADAKGLVLITGSVRADALVFGAGHSEVTVWESLAANSIYMVEVV